MKIYITLLFFTSLMLSGCNKLTPTESCSSPDTQKLIKNLLTEKVVKLTTEKRYEQYDGSFIFGATKIRASLDQIQIVVEIIKTIKQDPNSSKSFCSGQLKVTIPSAMLNDAELARDSQHQLKIAQFARQLNIENNNNVYTHNVEYTVKPIGEGKESHVEFEDSTWAHLLDEIVTATLLKPTLDIQETTYVQKDEPPKQTVELIKPDVEQKKLATEKIRVMQEKQGLDKLNKELFEAEQLEKELSQAPNSVKDQAFPPVVVQSMSLDKKHISPSFNCANITKPTETTICVTPELAALDIENMQVYKKAKASDPVATHAIWKESIKSKYACGSDIDCIKSVYNKSIMSYGCVTAEDKADCIDTRQ